MVLRWLRSYVCVQVFLTKVLGTMHSMILEIGALQIAREMLVARGETAGQLNGSMTMIEWRQICFQ